jgi:hypothetical protein
VQPAPALIADDWLLSSRGPLPEVVHWVDLEGGHQLLDALQRVDESAVTRSQPYPTATADGEMMGLPIARSFVAYWTARGVPPTEILQDLHERLFCIDEIHRGYVARCAGRRRRVYPTP